jgi:hypothetical protein
MRMIVMMKIGKIMKGEEDLNGRIIFENLWSLYLLLFITMKTTMKIIRHTLTIVMFLLP